MNKYRYLRAGAAVIIGILTAGLVIFGIMQLIKLAKKTFSKVAG